VGASFTLMGRPVAIQARGTPRPKKGGLRLGVKNKGLPHYVVSCAGMQKASQSPFNPDVAGFPCTASVDMIPVTVHGEIEFIRFVGQE
jgi:hypothetical protein